MYAFYLSWIWGCTSLFLAILILILVSFFLSFIVFVNYVFYFLGWEIFIFLSSSKNHLFCPLLLWISLTPIYYILSLIGFGFIFSFYFCRFIYLFEKQTNKEADRQNCRLKESDTFQFVAYSPNSNKHWVWDKLNPAANFCVLGSNVVSGSWRTWAAIHWFQGGIPGSHFQSRTGSEASPQI